MVSTVTAAVSGAAPTFVGRVYRMKRAPNIGWSLTVMSVFGLHGAMATEDADFAPSKTVLMPLWCSRGFPKLDRARDLT